MNRPLQSRLAAAVAVIGLTVLGTLAFSPAAQATANSSTQTTTDPAPITGPDPYGLCYQQTTITEYEYSKVVKGRAETTHNEYTYKRVGTVYTVEHKQVKGWFFDKTQGGYATINGRTFTGKWVQGDANTYYSIPDDMVNAAGVNPYTVAQSGTVDLRFYGYTGYQTVPYKITGIDVTTTPPTSNLFVKVTNTTFYYTGTSTISVNSADAVYTATNPGSPWVQFGPVKVVGNNDAVPDVTYYYLPGGGQDTTKPNADTTVDDPHWTTDAMPAGWSLDAKRDKKVNTKVNCKVDAATPRADITSLCQVATTNPNTTPGTSEVKVVASNPYTAQQGHVGTAVEFWVSVDGGAAKSVGTIKPGGADLTITSAQDSELSFPAGSGTHTVVVKANQSSVIAQTSVNANACNLGVTFVAPTPPVNNTCVNGVLNRGSVETFADLQKAQPTGITLALNADKVTGTITAAQGYVLKSGSPTTFTLGTVGGPTGCARIVPVLASTGMNESMIKGGALLGVIVILLGIGGVLMARGSQRNPSEK